uniref:Uncharacterized Fe-S protein n=1 Tax=uncultured nuHF1 cluster bacterium HF0770_35I22 TaxID=723586 RepID=E7C7P4_9BACT|nr:uncharacterized Fe-S protein [uncultured nuHF1 cluster bacterium HF0770_35I22]
MTSCETKKQIKILALEEGFDSVAITSASANPKDFQSLEKFLRLKYHGEMSWLEKNRVKRGNPKKLMPNVNSIITLGKNYSPQVNPLNYKNDPVCGKISCYAQTMKDYHKVIKKALKRICQRIAFEYESEIKLFVDTAPIMEKPLAARAGLGWQGKHTNLVSRSFGSWLFLGEIFTSLKLEPDLPEADHCGSCSACLQACPTGAFPKPYQLDSNKCISYLTIEHSGLIDGKLMELMGNHIYGCDDCLAVCPWNKFSSPTADPNFQPRPELVKPKLKDLVKLTDKEFRSLFSGSAIKRTGRDRFIRNVLIAIGNSRDQSFFTVLRKLKDDPSPLVAKTAEWALLKLKNRS